jgi:hypothetical protein
MYLDNLYRKGETDLGVAAKASDSSAAAGPGREGVNLSLSFTQSSDL